jgi:acyl-CoA thioesterase-1
MKRQILAAALAAAFLAVFISCAAPDSSSVNTAPIHYLALGDSYTIGESVNSDERWPAQLAALIGAKAGQTVELEYRARTGWTTGELLASLSASPPQRSSYDLVSVLIGVNNQFRGYDFSIYRGEAARLVDLALEYAGGRPEALFVVSIPDYAYTPYGSRRSAADRQRISRELDAYNDWMEEYCRSRGIAYLYITDITRRGLDEPSLVARDGLHPSGEAYTLFAARAMAEVDFPVSGSP